MVGVVLKVREDSWLGRMTATAYLVSLLSIGPIRWLHDIVKDRLMSDYRHSAWVLGLTEV